LSMCAHTFHSTCTDTRKLTSDAHARTRAAKEEYEHARGTAEGYSRVGTRTAVRQCVHAHAGARADTNGPERSLAGARRGIVRGAGAQDTQLLELRQRGGDRAVERVREERPATCMVRPAVQRNAYAPVRATHSKPAQHAVAAWVFVREGTAHGYSRGCCTRALFVPGRRKALQPRRSAHTPSIGVLRTIPSTPRRWATARGCCQRTRGHVRRGDAHGRATVRADARRGAHGHQGAGARTHARGAALRAWRAHRKLSKLSADSAAGIVPSSEFEAKDLRRAWFVPLCREMRMHRSTHLP